MEENNESVEVPKLTWAEKRKIKFWIKTVRKAQKKYRKKEPRKLLKYKPRIIGILMELTDAECLTKDDGTLYTEKEFEEMEVMELDGLLDLALEEAEKVT